MFSSSYAIHLPDGVILTVEQQIMEFSVLSAPDERWRFTDTGGHEHCYTAGAEHYPTLRTVYGEPYWCDTCRDDHRDSRLECRLCGEKITPGTAGPVQASCLGARSTWLDHVRATDEEAGQYFAGGYSDGRSLEQVCDRHDSPRFYFNRIPLTEDQLTAYLSAFQQAAS